MNEKGKVNAILHSLCTWSFFLRDLLATASYIRVGDYFVPSFPHKVPDCCSCALNPKCNPRAVQTNNIAASQGHCNESGVFNEHDLWDLRLGYFFGESFRTGDGT